MKKLAFAALAVALFIVSCKKKEHEMTPSTPVVNIDYPAAHIVNGGSNSISVIRLSNNTVSATLDLTKMSMSGMGTMSTNITWPHHIYLNPSKTQLTVGVPGMDMSGGHS